MSANKRWTPEEAERVLDQLANAIEAGSAADIAAEMKGGGYDLNDVAGRTKAAALAGIKQFRQQRLHQARQQYQESSARIERHTRRLGWSPDERRQRFQFMLAAKPEFRAALTMQYRDLSNLTDSDIESALEELEILGALEETDDAGS